MKEQSPHSKPDSPSSHSRVPGFLIPLAASSGSGSMIPTAPYIRPCTAASRRVPENYAVGNGSMMEFSDSSAFWIFNQVSNFAYTKYSYMIPEIQAKQQELETGYMTGVQRPMKLRWPFIKAAMRKRLRRSSLTIHAGRGPSHLIHGRDCMPICSPNIWMATLKPRWQDSAIPV